MLKVEDLLDEQRKELKQEMFMDPASECYLPPYIDDWEGISDERMDDFYKDVSFGMDDFACTRDGCFYLTPDEFRKYVMDRYNVPTDSCSLAPGMLDGILGYASSLFNLDERLRFLTTVFPEIPQEILEVVGR